MAVLQDYAADLDARIASLAAQWKARSDELRALALADPTNEPIVDYVRIADAYLGAMQERSALRGHTGVRIDSGDDA